MNTKAKKRPYGLSHQKRRTKVVMERHMFYSYDERLPISYLQMMAHVDGTLRVHPTLSRLSVLPAPQFVELPREVAA